MQAVLGNRAPNVVNPIKLVVYVAGPIGQPIAHGDNYFAASATAEQLLDQGFSIVLPHLFLFLKHRPYEEWMEIDDALLRKCDAVFRMDGESPGADREVARAHEIGIPVFYSVNSIGAWQYDQARAISHIVDCPNCELATNRKP